jgi:hypothetical protein
MTIVYPLVLKDFRIKDSLFFYLFANCNVELPISSGTPLLLGFGAHLQNVSQLGTIEVQIKWKRTSE